MGRGAQPRWPHPLSQDHASPDGSLSGLCHAPDAAGCRQAGFECQRYPLNFSTAVRPGCSQHPAGPGTQLRPLTPGASPCDERTSSPPDAGVVSRRPGGAVPIRNPVERQRICLDCQRPFRTKASRRQCSRCRHQTPCPICGGPMRKYASQRCRYCTARDPADQAGSKNHAWRGGRTYHRRGYVMYRVEGRYVFEHILVMEEHLGRKLIPGENVHHRNGVRDDNRIENLELWTKPQPSGIRAEDAVEWAREILRRHSPDDLAAGPPCWF